MPRILDVEQALLLLELEPPFDQRAVQLARRRMAKRWHPDIAPPGRQHEHQRHLQAINEAADQLEQLAEQSRGGKVSRNAVKVSAAAARKAREEEGRRAYEAEQRQRAAAEERAKYDPFGSRVPDHSVVHRYARCVSYPEWGVGSVTGIYFSGDGDDVQQWARVKFSIGIRTIPAGSLQFVDFSTPDPAADRVQRFMTAAQHALAEGDAALAAQRLIYARDADPMNPVVLRLLTSAFWQAGNLPAAARAVRDWARAETDRPTPERFAARIYEDMGAIDLAAEAAERAANRAPADASSWERLGRLRLRLMDRPGAISALERARLVGPTVEGLLVTRARLPPGRRRRGRGFGRRGGDASGTGLADRLERLRPRAGPHRSGVRVHRGLPPGAGPRRQRRGRRPARARPGRPAPLAVRANRGLALAGASARPRPVPRTPKFPPIEAAGKAADGKCGLETRNPAANADPRTKWRKFRGRGGRAGGSLGDRAFAAADRAGLAGRQRTAATAGAVLDGLQDPQQLADPAHEQPLLLDLDPHAGARREHHVVAGSDRHRDPHVIPPVEPGADREHDAVLGRRLLGAGRHEQPGAANPIGVELLDHDAVE